MTGPIFLSIHFLSNQSTAGRFAQTPPGSPRGEKIRHPAPTLFPPLFPPVGEGGSPTCPPKITANNKPQTVINEGMSRRLHGPWPRPIFLSIHFLSNQSIAGRFAQTPPGSPRDSAIATVLKQIWTIASHFGTLRPSSAANSWQQIWISSNVNRRAANSFRAYTAMSRLSRWRDLILPIGIITSVLVILVPMPPFSDGRAASRATSRSR